MATLMSQLLIHGLELGVSGSSRVGLCFFSVLLVASHSVIMLGYFPQGWLTGYFISNLAIFFNIQ
jgi:hypothetical protein